MNRRFRLKPSIFLSIVTLTLLPLGSCANSPWASQLENSLAADPQLQANAASPEVTPTVSPASVELPASFPAEIPRYPDAQLLAVTEPDATQSAELGSSQPVQTRWQTADAVEQVQQFYQEKLQADGWQIASAAPAQPNQIRASKDGLELSVAVQRQANNTELSLDYQIGDLTAASGSSPAPSPAEGGFIGPMPQVAGDGNSANRPDSSPAAPTNFSDLNKAPAELQPYLADLAKLGVFSTQSSEFKPNAEISRREYVRWLVAANNLIYSNQSARKVRLATASDKAVFQDIPSSDPDFGAIQGLANAGVIPSSLSGDSASVMFRPDAPLTREDLILWKIPLDLRQALPSASIDTIQKTWGFQDTAKINPNAMRAVLADYQSGDLSNIRRAFGYTSLFQPQKTVSRAEAASVLWQFGSQGNSLNAKDALQIKSTAQQPAAQP